MIDLKHFRRVNDLTQDELGEFLEMKKSFISKIENGKEKLPSAKFQKLMENPKGWDTSMLQHEIHIEHRASKRKESKGLPVLSFSAMAGYMGENNSVALSDEIERCIIPDFTARGADFLIRVDGDSMYPRYANGELLAVRVIEPTFFQWGRVYAMSTQQGCVVKKIFPDPSNENNILCHSENCENYPDYTIPKSEVLKFAIVVGHAGID